MTQYSSRKPFNDPYPNVWAGHSEYNQMRADTDMFRKGAPSNHISMDYRHRPRPEFDRPQTNPTNPVLTWAREVGVRTALDEVTFSSGSYLVGSWVGDQRVTSAHVVHARTVLTRLANLKEES